MLGKTGRGRVGVGVDVGVGVGGDPMESLARTCVAETDPRNLNRLICLWREKF